MPAITVTIEEAFWDYLISNTNYSFYAQHLPQKIKEYPVVIYSKQQGGREYNLQTRIGIEHPVFSLDVYGETYLSTVETSNDIKSKINGFHGTWRGISIYQVVVRTIADLPPERINGSDKQLFHQVITLEIWYARV